MPTLKDLGFDPETGVMLGDIGTGAGAFPQPPVMNFIDQQNATRSQGLTGDPAAEAQYKIDNAGMKRYPGIPPAAAGGTPFNSRVTYYAPGPGDKMEGPWATSRPNPVTGQRIPYTLDDVRLGRSPFVTVASDPSRYGQTVQLGDLTYRSPIDGKTYTVPQVQGYVHDTGGAFRGRPDKLDVAAGDFRGWTPAAASAYVQADGGRRMVTAGPGSPMGGWETSVGADPSGVGYAAPDRVAQGATTNPAELVREEPTGFDWTKMIGGLKYNPKQIKPTEPFTFDKPLMRMTPIGRKRAQAG